MLACQQFDKNFIADAARLGLLKTTTSGMTFNCSIYSRKRQPTFGEARLNYTDLLNQWSPESNS
jgi:hypothetical protein